MICIYDTKNKYNHEFNSQEHIIPACIGGIRTLNKGYVCDYVNKDIFSKLEINFARHSYIEFLRPMIGPGKRGSLNKNKQTTSHHFKIMELDDNRFIICKLRMGKPIYEAQIHIKKDKLIYTNYNSDIDSIIFINEIPEELANYTLINEEKLTNEIIISRFEGRFYLFFDNIAQCDLTKYILEAKKINTSGSGIISTSHDNPIIHNKYSFNIYEYNRIMGKIAFNTLAYLYGKDFVLNKRFDSFRSWILGDADDRFTLSDSDKSNNTYLKNILPDHSHSIIFFNMDGNLICLITLYSIIYYDFLICKVDKQEQLDNGYICDWKNRKEYVLNDYIINKLSFK